MELVRFIHHHVSNDTVIEFESLIIQKGIPLSKKKNRNIVRFFVILFEITKLLGVPVAIPTLRRYRSKPLTDRRHIFHIMMGLNEYMLRYHSLTSFHSKSVYLFDAWPGDCKKIADFANDYKIDYLFVTASQSVEMLLPKLQRTRIYWIPEGINPLLYKQKPYSERQTDLLALGRKYEMYHQQICESLSEKGVSYLYEKIKGEVIFPTREGFIDGLANSKISVCIPSSITHPERSGNIETMTVRYLQSICSKCLILGHAPDEMIHLFGYNPVIEIDYDRPVEQIMNILSNFDSYIPLIEKNYTCVIDNHTWNNRWEQINSFYKEVELS
jgi:hypothetical protein